MGTAGNKRAVILLVFGLLLAALAGCGESNDSSASDSGGSASKGSESESAIFREPGQDNYVTEFGEEGTVAEREEVADVLRSYLGSRIQHEWAKACSFLTKNAQRDVVAKSVHDFGKGGGGCVASLERITPFDLPPVVAKRVTSVDPRGLRVEDDLEVLLYYGYNEPPFFALAERNGGELKIAFRDPRRLYLGRPGLQEMLNQAEGKALGST